MDYYFRFFAKENVVRQPVLSEEIKSILKNYIWPGNIRELRNFSENMVVMHSGQQIEISDLDPKFLTPLGHDEPPVTLKEKEQKAFRNGKFEKRIFLESVEDTYE